MKYSWAVGGMMLVVGALVLAFMVPDNPASDAAEKIVAVVFLTAGCVTLALCELGERLLKCIDDRNEVFQDLVDSLKD